MKNEFPWKKTHEKFGLEKSDTKNFILLACALLLS